MRKILPVILALCASLAYAQQFQHVIIVVQENRTPDNLFSDCDIPGANAEKKGAPIALDTEYNPDHRHSAFVSQSAGHWDQQSFNYVEASDIKPYCELGAEYGFANQMFQTNQGPSTPAHQFLFSATSMLNETSDLFESEGVSGGCLEDRLVNFIDPSGDEDHMLPACLNPQTLADLLEAAGLSWRYYQPSVTSMWSAPVAIEHICLPVNGVCTGPDWKNVINNPPQLLSDISGGKLAQVSWVIPAAGYSDHPSYGSAGPAWVASIVNAVGKSSYWENTAILVTWDDWGGWYDHVSPLANKTGWCVSYCYGFRVPLLVISSYTPSMVDNNTHDFGSIVHFVESNWGLPSLGFADAYADDLSGFFPHGRARVFKTVQAPETDFSDRGDPDDD
jgi:phospholipase C